MTGSTRGSAPVRIAVAGAGLIGARHVRLALAEPDCELVSVADPSPAGETVAREAGVAWHRDHLEMLEDVRPDAVIVATPNDLHAAVAIDCARRGVHVLVEKPVTDTVQAGRSLLAAAREERVRVLVGHHRRYDPAVEHARTLLEAGAIGRLLAVQCLWSARKDDPYFAVAWRARRPGGGPVLINLIHDVDLIRHLCGDVERVHAEVGHAARGHEVEDTAVVTLRLASGALGTITASDAAPSPWGWEQATGENPGIPQTGRNPYRLLGTEGSLGFPRLDLWRHDDRRAGGWNDALTLETTEVGARASLARQLAHFCRVARGEEAPRISGADGLRTLAATEAILASARAGEPVAPEHVEAG